MTHFIFIKYIFENRAVYKIMRKDTVKLDRPKTTIKFGAEKVRVACRVTKARIQAYTPNIYYCLRFLAHSGYSNAPWNYFIRT